VEGETAGDPVSHTTVGRLLHDQHYTLKANEKRLSGAAHPNQQFEYLEKLKAVYLAAAHGVVRLPG
jgi:hypothetical protein